MDDPVKFSPKQLITSTKLVRNLASYLDLAKEYPLFITRNRGEDVEFVLMDLEHYRGLLKRKKEEE